MRFIIIRLFGGQSWEYITSQRKNLYIIYIIYIIFYDIKLYIKQYIYKLSHGFILILLVYNQNYKTVS